MGVAALLEEVIGPLVEGPPDCAARAVVASAVS
jgi:hypothetical protein